MQRMPEAPTEAQAQKRRQSAALPSLNTPMLQHTASEQQHGDGSQTPVSTGPLGACCPAAKVLDQDVSAQLSSFTHSEHVKIN